MQWEDLLDEEDITQYPNTYQIELLSHDDNDDNELDTVVKIIVNQRKVQAMMMTASSWLLEGTTGQCGNYNGNKDDDIGQSPNVLRDAVPPSASLFPDENPQLGDSVRAFDCPNAAKTKWSNACHNAHKRVS